MTDRERGYRNFDRYVEKSISRNLTPLSSSDGFVVKVTCNRADIRFGTMSLTQNHDGIFIFSWCSMYNRWKITLQVINTNGSNIAVDLFSESVNKICACLEPDILMIQLIPKIDAANQISSIFNFPGSQIDLLDASDGPCIHINFGLTVHQQKDDLLQELKKYAHHLKLDMLSDNEARSILTELFSAQKKKTTLKRIKEDKKKETESKQLRDSPPQSRSFSIFDKAGIENCKRFKTETTIIGPTSSKTASFSVDYRKSFTDSIRNGPGLQDFIPQIAKCTDSFPAQPRVLMSSTKYSFGLSESICDREIMQVHPIADSMTLDEHNDGNQDSGCKTKKRNSAAPRLSRRSECCDILLSMPSSIISEFEKILQLGHIPDCSSSRPRVTRSNTATAGKSGGDEMSTASNSVTDFIDLCDDEEFELNALQPAQATPIRHSDVPDGAHLLFHHLHNFGEITLVNSVITPGDVFQLAKGQMLGDSIVQFMIEIMKYSFPKDEPKRMHILPYFFFQTYLGAMREHNVNKLKEVPASVLERIRNYTKFDIFDYEYLIIPVLYEQHWYVVVVCHPGDQTVTDQDPCFVILDSLNSSGSKVRHRFTFNLIGLWLKTEYESKNQRVKAFQAKDYPRVVPKVPQQQNGVDCGVFMLRNMIQFIRGRPIFGQKSNLSTEYCGRSPNLSSWYRNDDTYVECMRLHILHHYCKVAQFKHFFVYRDSYILDIIDRMLKNLSEEDEDNHGKSVLTDSPLEPYGSLQNKRRKVGALISDDDTSDANSTSGKHLKTKYISAKAGSLPGSLVSDYLSLMDQTERDSVIMDGKKSGALENTEVELPAAKKIQQRTRRMEIRRLCRTQGKKAHEISTTS